MTAIRFWCGVLALALLPRAASAAIIFDNFDVGGGFSSQSYSVVTEVISPGNGLFARNLRYAVQFTVTGDSVPLYSITLPLAVGKAFTTDDIIRVRLTDDSGGAPGATLEVLSENEDIWPSDFQNIPPTTLISSGNPLLVAGASYWIVVEPTAIPTAIPPGDLFFDYLVQAIWFQNTSGAIVPFRNDFADPPSLPSDPWENLGQHPQAFRVEGIPEPSIGVLLGSGLVGLAARRSGRPRRQ